MWYASKTDSALYYFNMALDAVRHMEPKAENQHYRPAVLLNNMAVIHSQQGKATLAIDAMKRTINHLSYFLATKEPHPKKDGALLFQFEAASSQYRST